MKKQLTIIAVALVLVGGGWLLSGHLQRNVQRAVAMSESAPALIATETSIAQNASTEARTMPRPVPLGSAKPVAAPASVAVDFNAPLEPAHVAEIHKALEELKTIYGSAGSLDWEAARRLIAQRQKASEELVERLAQLGPGGARAMAASYTEADSTRARLLLVRSLGKVRDDQAPGALEALLERDKSFSLRKEMVLALRQRPEASAEQVLTDMLANEGDAQLRFASAQALSGREKALPALAQRLRSETHSDVQRELVRSVGLVRNDQAKGLLAGIAHATDDSALRQTAIQELGRTFGARALDDLNRLLSDPDEAIRKCTVTAVARVKNAAATALLQHTASTDASPIVRNSAIRALTQ